MGLSQDRSDGPWILRKVGAGDLESPHDPNYFFVLQVIDYRQCQQVIFHEQLQRPIQGVVGCERPDVAPHQVCGQNQRLQCRCLRGEVDFLQVDYAQKPTVSINHWQYRKRNIAQTVDYSGQWLIGVQSDNCLLRAKETRSREPRPGLVGHSFPDGLAKENDFRLARHRWIVHRRE